MKYIKYLLVLLVFNFSLFALTEAEQSLFDAVNRKDYQNVSTILSSSPDININASDMEGYTSLHRAIVNNDLNTVMELLKNENIDVLINNAGFGLFGDYNSCDLLTELKMIDVNIKAVHILTRMFLKDMVKKNKGYILNVASSAGLLRGGPLMNTYYATKSYVTSFTLAISEELRRNKSNVKIGVLCPGPVKTNFNNVAGVKFNMSSLSSRYVARYAIDKFLREGKTIIIPGFKVRFGLFFSRFLSIKSLVRITYKFQRRKK